tara:strand:- start:2901 stop:3293 length:393 start_codon:yes stop_codon:yes gene_type:complete
MATQISSDIATEVDITARKDDSFFLRVTLTKADGTAYNFSTYDKSNLIVLNSNGEIVRDFRSATTSVNLPNVASAISLTNASTGILTISTAGSNMSIPKGTYSYRLAIENTTETPQEKITLMVGKFKINA